MKIRRKLEEIRVVLINSNFSEIRSSEFADADPAEARWHCKTRSNNNGLVAAAGPGTTGTRQVPPWQEK